MKSSAQSGWCRYTSVAVATLTFTAALVLAPRTGRAQFTCTGDCNGNLSVTVNEIITLVGIVLGTKTDADCAHGLMAGQSVNVGTILKAVGIVISGVCTSGGGTPTPTVTPSSTAAACGNGVVDAGEDCDNGGTCRGGPNAGTHCTADSQCQGQGECLGGGDKAYWACDSDADCDPSAGGKCVHCVPEEGNGCAANCTSESTITINLVPGQSPDNVSLMSGTSGLIVDSPTLTVAIPFPQGTSRQLTVGKKGSDGTIPGVLKAANNQTAGITVLGGSACICLRPVILSTCGGTLWEKDGTPSTDCTDGYTAGASLCPAAKACTFAYGADNAGVGTIGCNGLTAVNVTTTQDSLNPTPGPVLTTITGSGPAGSAIVYVSTELGFVIAACTGTDATMYGADGMFCTNDDPQSARGAVLPQVLTTGTATSSVINADQTADNTVGPFSSTGAALTCNALPSTTGGALAGAFPDINAPVVGDIVVTDIQVSQ